VDGTLIHSIGQDANKLHKECFSAGECLAVRAAGASTSPDETPVSLMKKEVWLGISK
jgi:hypothetical protein